LAAGNAALYYYYYADISQPRELPYFEDFTADRAVEYRQISGSWAIEDDRLVQKNGNLADLIAVIPSLTLSPEQNYTFSANMTILEGPKGGGLLFNMQEERRLHPSHLVRLGRDGETDYLIYGYFDEERVFQFQGSMNPEGLGDEFRLGVKIENGTYSVLLNNEPVAEGVELYVKGGYLSPTSWNSVVAFDDISVVDPATQGSAIVDAGAVVVDEMAAEAAVVVVGEPASASAEEAVVVVGEPASALAEDAPVVVIGDAPVEGEAQPAEPVAEAQVEPAVEVAPVEEAVVVEEAAPAEDVVVAEEVVPAISSYAETFEGVTELSYPTLKGDWALQNGALAQTNAGEVDTVAILPDVTFEAGSSYDLKADMTMLDGFKGGGFYFNMQSAETIAGSHMLRFGLREDGSEYLIYGSFDDVGGFAVQGLVEPIGAYESQVQLTVQVRGDVYNVLQNDQVLLEGVPLVYSGGRLGLTSWNTAVEFDNVEVISR
ncbi:MAG: hypothetical protein AAF902_17815, partial [Chloroflexota bacterium]